MRPLGKPLLKPQLLLHFPSWKPLTALHSDKPRLSASFNYSPPTCKEPAPPRFSSLNSLQLLESELSTELSLPICISPSSKILCVHVNTHDTPSPSPEYDWGYSWAWDAPSFLQTLHPKWLPDDFQTKVLLPSSKFFCLLPLLKKYAQRIKLSERWAV